MIVHRLAVAATIAIAASAPAGAQAPVPQEPAPPPVQLGPLSFRPVFTLRDVGVDSNVFNQAGQPESDFTATVGAKVDVGMRLPRLEASYSTYYEYMYFKAFSSERGSNRGVEGRGDVLLGRLRPYLAGGVTRSNDRPTAEIDARAEREQRHAAVGLNALVFSHTNLSVVYRRTRGEYAGDETFRGVNLAEELNGRTGTLSLAADFELTPLTTVSVHAERQEDRFESSAERDADSYRFGVTATTQPIALISGRASLGVRAFKPKSDLLEEFTGLVAAISVGYSLREDTRLNLVVDRDLRYSFEQLTPYYVSTATRATVTKQLIGRFDAQGFGGIERIGYKARADAPSDGGTDSVGTFGAGLGYRLGDGGRLALNLERTSRSSASADREYGRTRLFTTLTYGF